VSSEPETERKKGGWKRHYWALPVGLLVAMTVGELFMVYTAVDDPGFAVEKDYYKKAVHWDSHMDQTAENQRLGWKLALETRPGKAGHVELLVRIRDERGRPVRGASVRVETFFNARASHILTADLRDAGDGSYQSALPIRHRGLWEFRFTATQGRARFTDVVRRDVDPSGGA
jgi:nitrogen fixation protein FixH